MSQSLASLVGNLTNCGKCDGCTAGKVCETPIFDGLKYTKSTFSREELPLVCRKGVYPYEWVISFLRFKEKGLPDKEAFYSPLTGEGITDEEYEHVLNVWKVFKMPEFGDYHDLYIKTDVLLLTDVFENFRKTCMMYYGLDPLYKFSAPGLSWDSMLKMTKVSLELMSDVDMSQFMEAGKRGGMSYIAYRSAEANNIYMSDYNPDNESSYIMYLDANNLYGWGMSQYLPTGGFRWLADEEIEKLDLQKYTDESDRGLFLEVDLEYPKELHDYHNDFPLAPEKMKITKEMLSDYCRDIADHLDSSTGDVKKLVPNLKDKSKYFLHYRNLKLYLSLGMRLVKIHRVLEFNQSPWLKPYIDYNTGKRKIARNTFEKNFFKLMNNSVYGKTMENLYKRVDLKLVTNIDDLLKHISKPSFVNSKILSEDLVAVSKIKETLTLDRPSYVGVCILELSKVLMYDFHYNYIKKKYGDRAQLLMTDTDRLMYQIKTDDVYLDFWDDRDKFDLSDFPKNSPFYDGTYKKVIGKMKDESPGVPITRFYGLRSKMYAYGDDRGKESKKAKGTKKSVVSKEIKLDNYQDVLIDSNQMRHKMKTIRSKNHKLGTYEINKISLSCFDDKRYILDDGVTSYAYGHYRIANL